MKYRLKRVQVYENSFSGLEVKGSQSFGLVLEHRKPV